jgi:hypothetical protein
MSKLITWSQFTEIVESNFSFLITQYGFESPLNKEPTITYKSPYVQVQIFHDLNGRWDLEVTIDSVQNSPLGDFSIDSLEFEKLHRKDWNVVAPRYPSNQPDYLESLMNTEANRLKRYCKEVLDGNLEDVRRIKLLRQELRKRLTLDYQNSNRGKGFTTMITELMNKIIKGQHWRYDE